MIEKHLKIASTFERHIQYEGIDSNGNKFHN